jgi:hypothetical protein
MQLIEALVFGWLGAITMFILTVSPTVFTALDVGNASKFLRAYFPRLFKYELSIGIVLFLISFYLSFTESVYVYGLCVGGVVSAFALINLLYVMPAVNDAADFLATNVHSEPSTKRRFVMLHGLSVSLFGLNAIAMIALIAFGSF